MKTVEIYSDYYSEDSNKYYNRESCLRILKHYGHEVSHYLYNMQQIIYSLDLANNKLNDGKIKEIVNDMIDMTNELMLLNQSICILQDIFDNDFIKKIIPITNIKNDDLTLMMENILQRYTRESMRKVIHFITTDDKMCSFYCRSHDLELMLCHLIENAIKHSYYGTNVYIDFSQTNENKSLIKIINYGHEISNTEEPYKLFSTEHYGSGFGSGLYIVRFLSSIFNGKIKHYCEKISDFNVPLLALYTVKEFQDYLRSELYDNLKNEHFRLINENIYNVIVNKDITYLHDDLSYKELLHKVSQHTYKITFELSF